jgi:beta-glucosidase/6-phospho-beta-glucosidase/beta-galactosidase
MDSWFMGGFECSALRFADGRRIDMIAATRHDTECRSDYEQLRALGVRSVRDALRWHLIERQPGRHDWSSAAPMIEAAGRVGVQVIWDLCHFGIPDHIDLLADDFPDRFGDFAAAAARLVASLSDGIPWWCPINEISYWAFAAGTQGYMWPSAPGRADAIKRQLVRASSIAMARVRDVDARARFLIVDPLVHITDVDGPSDASRAEVASMYAAWDMLADQPEGLDVIGVNYYPANQWMVGSREPVSMGARHYRPLRLLLQDVWDRYHRPIVISETGAEAPSGPGWLRYVAGEARAAMLAGVPVEGLCIYSVMDYPAWVDGRHCSCGLIRLGDDGRCDHDEMVDALQAEQHINQLLFGPQHQPVEVLEC